jgi:hypothetical protein
MVGIAFVAVLTTGAHAVPQIYVATLDTNPGFDSSFTLDFGGGFIETARISDTDFTLEVDPDIGPMGAARFLAYSQQIDPINLPDPTGGSSPISTGDITVEILTGSSGAGSYNASSGVFTTDETYRIHYTGDLSAYGLTDGFVDLPSTSNGQILLGTATGDRIEQVWEGTYTFPGTTVSLAYACRVNTQIVPEAGCLALLAPVGVILLRRRGG